VSELAACTAANSDGGSRADTQTALMLLLLLLLLTSNDSLKSHQRLQ